MNFDGMKFKSVDGEGKETECEIIHAFDSEETQKSYIVYTDGATGENGKLRYFASSYTMDGESLLLNPVDSEKEWTMIDQELFDSENNI